MAIIKNQNNEKWLILKKKYMPTKENEEPNETKVPELPSVPVIENEPVEVPPPRPPLPLQLNQDFGILANIIQDTTNSPLQTAYEPKENLELQDDTAPKLQPRRKSSADKTFTEKRSSIPYNNDLSKTSDTEPTLTLSRSESMLIDSEQKISVKERKQMFNRMASESDVLKTQKMNFNTSVSIEIIFFFNVMIRHLSSCVYFSSINIVIMFKIQFILNNYV